MACTLKDVSIAIVTYKGDDLTRNCLDSLAAACGDEPQIVVVDNSPSGTTHAIVAVHPNTVYRADFQDCDEAHPLAEFIRYVKGNM